MLADNGYQWFVEQGGLTRENGDIFRHSSSSGRHGRPLSALLRQTAILQHRLQLRRTAAPGKPCMKAGAAVRRSWSRC
jgi:hypothetical protein